MWQSIVAVPYYVLLIVLILLSVRVFVASQKQMKGPKKNEG